MKKFLPLLLLLAACNNQSAVILKASFANDTILNISGIDNATLSKLGNDAPAILQQLVQVYRMPTDTDMKDYQPQQPGAYILKGDKLYFVADTPFVEGARYFLRYYEYESGGICDLIKFGHKPGDSRYTEIMLTR
jgi:hypothetical protein